MSASELKQALVAKGWRETKDGLLVLRNERQCEDKRCRPFVVWDEVSLEVYEHAGHLHGAVWLKLYDESGSEVFDDFKEDLTASVGSPVDIVAEIWHDATACLIP